MNHNEKPKQAEDDREKNAEKQEISLDAKVTLRNIAGWAVGFARRADGAGDVNVPPNGTVRLSRNEVFGQVQSGNKLITGTDDMGSHATLYIEDAKTRLELGYEGEDFKQKVITEESVKRLCALRQTEFEKALPGEIVTRAEKYALIRAMKKLGINDYSKIRCAEKHTGYRFDDEKET